MVVGQEEIVHGSLKWREFLRIGRRGGIEMVLKLGDDVRANVTRMQWGPYRKCLICLRGLVEHIMLCLRIWVDLCGHSSVLVWVYHRSRCRLELVRIVPESTQASTHVVLHP